MSEAASAEAMRIVRTLQVHFPAGPQQTGSAFVVGARGEHLTCAHVVVNRDGVRANRIVVSRPDGTRYEATLQQVDETHDLARLESTEHQQAPSVDLALPQIGRQVVFAGLPQGLVRASVFPGTVSAVGAGLLSQPRCELVQLSGMVNNGNSGGPVVDATSNSVIGIITAKYVPMLREIDQLSQQLEAIPQFPRDVAIGQIDFSAFVNMTIRSMWQIAAVLRLVQVGTGWSIPSKYFSRVGVN